MNQVKVTERVQKQLFELQDLQYRDFQAKTLADNRERNGYWCANACASQICKRIMEKQKKQKNS